MAKILAPNKAYTGTSAGVDFTGGVGYADAPWVLRWFTQHGYTVEETTPEAPQGDTDAGDGAEGANAPAGTKDAPGELTEPKELTPAQKGAATKKANAEAAAKAAEGGK